MPGGYFDDGQVQVELGAYAFATPASRRRNILLAPYGLPAAALQDGGGVLRVSSPCARTWATPNATSSNSSAPWQPAAPARSGWRTTWRVGPRSAGASASAPAGT